MSELNNQKINLKKLRKNVSKLVEKLNKYRIIFKDILTFLELDYREDSLIK